MTTIDLYSELYQLGNSKFAPGTDTYVWQDDAACYFSPPELFELDENDELSDEEFEQARKDCDRCPVWHMCYTSAAVSDFNFTVRAGIRPTGGIPEEESLPPAPVKRGKLCHRGHDEWVIRPSRGTWSCLPCKVAAKERRREGIVLKYKAGEGKCKKGHEDWGWNNGGSRGLQPYCKTCKKIRRRGLKDATVGA